MDPQPALDLIKQLLEANGNRSQDIDIMRNAVIDLLDRQQRRTDRALFYLRKYPEKCTVDSCLSNLIGRLDESSFIIWIPHLGVYAWFKNITAYAAFIDHATNDQSGDGAGIFRDFIKFQIVTTNMRQKLVFVCHDDGSGLIKDLQAIIKNQFGCESKTAYNEEWRQTQIVTELTMDNFASCKVKFDELRKHLTDRRILREVHLPHLDLDPVTKTEYMIPTVMHEDPGGKTFGNNTQLVAVDLVAGVPRIVFGNTVNGNLTVNIGCNTVIKKVKGARGEAETIAWINSNLPHKDEPLSDYYERYSKYMNGIGKRPQSASQIGKHVRSAGYESHGASSNRRWIRE